MPPRTRTRTVGRGHFRVVYDEGPLVRKQGYPPNIEHGTACNKAEALFWTQIRDTPDAIWFAPVVEVAPDYSWILQVKCGPYQGQDKTEALRVCERLGVWNVNSPANYGTLAGRLVVVDMAANPLLPWGPTDPVT